MSSSLETLRRVFLVAALGYAASSMACFSPPEPVTAPEVDQIVDDHLQNLLAAWRARDRAAAEAARRQLIGMGAAAAPSLGQRLRLAERVEQQMILDTLGNYGEGAAAASNDILWMSENEDPRLRASATIVLGRLGCSDPIRERLVALLDDDVTRVVMIAARALGACGEAGIEAVPALLATVRRLASSQQEDSYRWLSSRELVAAMVAIYGIEAEGNMISKLHRIRAGEVAKPEIEADMKATIEVLWQSDLRNQ